jgi:hypothetical protein
MQAVVAVLLTAVQQAWGLVVVVMVVLVLVMLELWELLTLAVAVAVVQTQPHNKVTDMQVDQGL